MKKNKIKLLGLSLVLVVAMTGCGTTGTKMRNMSTQTRLPNNVNDRWMNNNPLNTNDRLNTNLNDGMMRNNNNLNNGMMRNNNNLSDGMMGNNTNLNNGMMRNNTNLNSNVSDTNLNNGMVNNTNLSTNVNNLGTRANAIAKRVTALPEVTNASVLINGDTAIVGCNVNNATNNTVSSNLRKKVEAAVKVADKNIKNVSVTVDPTIQSRIKNLSTKINNGNPISSFTTEMNEILNSITAPLR